jgi:hypothetical protein
MNRRTTIVRRARRDESGSVIILVIAILVAVGVLVGALAALATPIFAHAGVTRNLNDANAAIDAGIEHGIQQLQTAFPTNPGFCPQTSPAQVPQPPTVNGSNYPVIVWCQTQSPPPAPGISQIVLTSNPGPGSGVTRLWARAVVQVNNFTGATTILSWRTCQDPQC